jgi:hypothetical protein
MNTKQHHIEYHYKSAFASHENVKTLAAAAWALGTATLDFGQRFRRRDKPKMQKAIKDFIWGKCDYYLGYLEFCERVLLLDEARGRYRGYSFSEWNNWFAEGNYFDNTKKDYELLLKKRKIDPELKKNWKGLAEAILEMQETPSPYIMQYWENWFTERKAMQEFELFRRAIGKSIHSV